MSLKVDEEFGFDSEEEAWKWLLHTRKPASQIIKSWHGELMTINNNINIEFLESSNWNEWIRKFQKISKMDLEKFEIFPILVIHSCCSWSTSLSILCLFFVTLSSHPLPLPLPDRHGYYLLNFEARHRRVAEKALVKW